MKTLKLEDFKANTKEWFLEQLGNMSAPQALQTISDLYDELHKPTYPKTYEECCKVLIGETDFHLFGFVPTFRDVNGNFDNEINPYAPYINVVNEFFSLLICRDAYWKIAGEELGLDKPWKPVWDESEDLYTIHTFNGEIRLSGTSHRNAIIVFPNRRNARYFL